MESRLAQVLKLRYHIIATIFTDDRPPDAVQFHPGRRGCVTDLLHAAARGKIAVVDRDTAGCRGAIAGMCFGSAFDQFKGGFEYFLSTGRGPGFPEGEGYKKTPELAREFVRNLPIQDLPTTYVVFKPLAQLNQSRDDARLITFLCNPDQLSALVVMTNYARPTNDNVIAPFAAGCQSICLLPYNESLKIDPKAVIGLLDVSARPSVPPDILAFTVPFTMFLQFENDLPGSFLERPAWHNVLARIPDSTSGPQGAQ